MQTDSTLNSVVPDDAVAAEEAKEEELQKKRRVEIGNVHRDKALSAVEKQRRIRAILSGDSTADNGTAKDSRAESASQSRPPSAPSFYGGNDALMSLATSQQEPQSQNRIFGCPHFKRDLYLLAPCCNKWYACRICHDDVEDHPIDRNNITQQCCMHCLQVTPIGALCTSTICNGRQLAHYYCEKCHTHRKETDLKFWHCDKCGMCRSGLPKVTYQHCDKCNLCYPSDSQHRCLQSSSAVQSCPICSQSIQNSQAPVIAMRCGHGIHVACLQKLHAQHDLRAMRCPLCKQSCEDMEMFWVQIDSLISTTIMPEPERNWTAHIGCNDCRQHTQNAAFHYYGLKCGPCGSYNTYIVTLYKNGVAEMVAETVADAQATGAARNLGEQDVATNQLHAPLDEETTEDCSMSEETTE